MGVEFVMEPKGMPYDSPGSFESELAALNGVEIIRDLKKA
jgi:hypothetical protein